MCGIIGYIGSKNDACSKVISGLKKLEYRGYDSAGIFMASKNKESAMYKSQGKITNLEEILNKNDTDYEMAIGHTRWATHGVPNEINAHPHKVGSVCLVHNGIIENYMEIRQLLEEKGYSFESETDTVVACGYIDYILKTIPSSNKLEVISKACSKFRGSYALSIIFDDDKENIYVARKDSPLIIGIADEGNFAASDISAILDYTNKFVQLESNEFGRISKDSYTVVNDKLEEVKKEVKIADWSSEEYSKNGYEHFMLKEMNEQPKAIDNLYKKYLSEDSILNTIDFSLYEKIDIVACGSAMHAGLVGKYLIENYAKIPVNVEVASEYRYKTPIITDKTLVIIISQSGETADSLAALRMAKENGATILGIVNAIGSTIARESDILLYTYAGPEIAVATTKGYTTQVALLSIIALKMAKKYISNEDISTIKDSTLNAYKLLKEVLGKTDEAKKIASKICEKNDLFFIGRGIDYTTCMEGSLKLKEISYMHSEAYAAGELKHGTISLIDNDVPVIAITTDKKLVEKTISNIKETKARGAYVIYITTKELDIDGDFYDEKIVLPSSSNFTNPLLTVAILQLISYYTAILRNCDIDKPKNLAKSVTVE